MSLSKTAAAAQKAVEKSNSKTAVERTPGQRLLDIRRNLASNLAVTPGDTRFLLALYDESISQLVRDAFSFIDPEEGKCGSITESPEDQSKFQL